MKSCPACKRTFEDTLTFCLIDGSVLSAPDAPDETSGATIPHITAPPATAILNPTTRPGGSRSPELSTIVSPQPLPLYSPKQQSQPEKQPGKPWMLIGIAVLVVMMVVVGAILSFIWLAKDAADNESNSNVANINVRPSPTATAKTGEGGWGATNDTASLSGERLTYYRGTTAEQCKADCDRDTRCNGFTLIRAGAYNPNDPAMCYQLSTVKEMVSHSCCISAIKRK